MIRNFAITAALAIGLTGCAGGIPGQLLNSQDTTAVQAFLTKAVAAHRDGLLRAKNDFLAATPQQIHGANCVGTDPDPTKPIDANTNAGTGVLSVLDAVQREIAANPPGSGFTAEEALAKSSLYSPNSTQFNWVVTQVETGCVAYLHDLNQAFATTAGSVFSAPALTALIAAPAGAENRFKPAFWM